eukprot:TRINITY_DN2995_c0_g1_i6.p1 TRINITY_DN2995_c0_g1~~TRINITY_DN2995_c0_g1_i6.p1  ORF type:complete len:323 (-),score=62.28 TRINITY_DN2995_c0_g1_i6:492-1460(-)
MSIKFYLHFEENPTFTHKVVCERSSTKNFETLLEEFVTQYNSKHGDLKRLDSSFLQVIHEKSILNPSTIITNVISEGTDLYVVEKKSTDVLRKCGRNGCGKQFRESENHDTACSFHPEEAIFHEGLKGWRCCSKRVTDFEDFLEITGCVVGRHLPEEPKPLPSVSPSQAKVLPTKMDVKISGEKEVYSDKLAPARPTGTSDPTTVSSSSSRPQPPQPEKEIPDSPDAVITVGTRCLHHCCSATFKDESSRKEVCTYHPGMAIFHEGSKGWSCCKAKALEFDELFNIEGCTEGVHKFVKTPQVLVSRCGVGLRLLVFSEMVEG